MLRSHLGQDKKIVRRIEELEVFLKYRPRISTRVHVISNLTGKVRACVGGQGFLNEMRVSAWCQGV